MLLATSPARGHGQRGQRVGSHPPAAPGPLLSCPYLAPPATSVPEVIARLESIQDFAGAHEPRGPHDGVACFSFLLHTITTRVRQDLAAGAFTDPGFAETLHLGLANRYLDALRASRCPLSTVPLAWCVLFDRRDRPGITRVQFAAAGVNAQLSFDLALTLADARSSRQPWPAAGPEHASCQELTAIFTAELEELRKHFVDTWERLVDQMIFRRAVNCIDAWAGISTRSMAWESAQHLLDLRAHDGAEAAFVDHLDEVASEAGRSLLTPVISPGPADAGRLIPAPLTVGP